MKMCEWLTCAEWCDVKFICGDREFNAHRAVLASMSTFLKNILLSCPNEESPILIVLPDFDSSVMKCVLHYIYNGEINIPKHQLYTFLEIMNAMQIFINYYQLPLLNAYSQNYPKYTIDAQRKICNNLNKNNTLMNIDSVNSVCFLGNVHKTDATYRFHRSIASLVTQNHLTYSKPHLILDTSKLAYGKGLSRTSSSDTFVQTFSLNSNCNGLPAGVQAISNRYYLGAPSFLSKNANGQYLSSNDTLLDESNSELSDIGSSRLKSLDYVDKQLYSNSQNCTNYDILSESHQYKEIECAAEEIIGMEYLRHKSTNDDTLCKSSHPRSISLDLTVAKNGILRNESKCTSSYYKEDKPTEILKSKVKKNVFNVVLKSPWCSNSPTLCKEIIYLNKENIKKDEAFLTNKSCAIRNNENRNQHTNLSIETKTCLEVQKKSYDIKQYAPRYTCKECNKTFSQLRNFKYHMSVHRGTKEFSTTCTECGKYFNDKGYLSSHMKIHRNRKEYKCSLCPKSFNQRVAYNMHFRIHTGVKPHMCEECGKTFSRKMLLKQHQRTHSGERPYACPHCDKRFADRSNMTLHLRLHTGIKPFTCAICSKSFTKKHHLKSHLNYHSGVKPYSCPRCQLGFTQSSNMRTHLKKCSVELVEMNT